EKSAKPQTKLQALCLLTEVGEVFDDVLLKCLKDEHPAVRRETIRLCESQELTNRVTGALGDLAADPDATVRLQLAYSIGNFPNKKSHSELLATVLRSNQSDRYHVAAVFSSLNAENIDGFALTVNKQGFDAWTVDILSELVAQLVAFDRQQALTGLLQESANQPSVLWSERDRRLMERFLSEMAKRNHPWKTWTEKPPANFALRLTQQLKASQRLARDNAAKADGRIKAARLARYGDWPAEDLADTLAHWLQPTQPPELQLAAVDLFRSRGDGALTTAVIGRWRELSPNTRNAVREALLNRTSGCVALLDAVAAGTLAVPDFDAATRQRLLDHPDGTIRKRAEELLGATTSQARAEVIARYQPVVHNGGDAARGGELFRKTCTQCHKLGEVGHVVGPDLRSLTDKSPEAMLTAVLDPNRAVETKYLTYTAVTAQGQSFTGLLASETATSLTLLAAEGKEHALLRADLEQLVAANKSLMPEGLEKDIAPEAMADLIAFVRANVPLPQRKEFPGNEPQVVKADADGKLALLPAAAEIYGSTIVLESQHGNLGWWSSADDHAVWTVDVPQSGKYRVELIWACDPQAAGHRLVIDGGKKPLTHRVTATANWDDYQTASVGEIELAAGVRRITLRPASRPLPALMDLKSVTLNPIR
ncbi:MAG TPA: CBM35 domain-containing protein, partial [Planctomycetaceae bacterium]|nr:CBM35 domain-containing protein [Planctomycetaceae bacterium]